MKKLPFTKMQGIGNDFVILNMDDLKRLSIELTREFVKRICNRNFGIGSDGLLIVDKGEKTEFKYIMYNPNGREAEMCGNGIRCYMMYLHNNGLTDKTNIDVETGAGILNLDMKGKEVTVNMGTPKLISELTLGHKELGDSFDIKSADREFQFYPVSTGNPHAVIFIDDKVADLDLNKYGKAIESNTNIFPRKVNVSFLNLISDTEMDMRVFERGAGETLACGTAASGCVVAGVASGRLKKDTFIKMNLSGGRLDIKRSGNMEDPIILKGPTENVFEGEYFVD